MIRVKIPLGLLYAHVLLLNNSSSGKARKERLSERMFDLPTVVEGALTQWHSKRM